ncbi:MAG TPA: TIGR01777 family oxidoreductase [candidate division Zixibacteria bacterium]|nr:TIGR01777 family oxidoreductase [candidate division Zixibacteria bacterium]
MPDGKHIRTVAVTGAGGFIGSALCAALEARGIGVLRFVRGSVNDLESEIRWAPPDEIFEREKLATVDAVAHLAGEPLIGRWTAAKKQRAFDSRVKTTELLVNAIRQSERRPRVFLSASAVGFYGSRGAEELTESSAPGSGYLAELCRAWEAAAQPLTEFGVRVVNARIAFVLDAQAPAVKQMLAPFKLGLGGVLADGSQYMSWITLRDLVAALLFILDNEQVSGPVNLAAPGPVTNREFTKALGSALRRPTIFRIPGFVLQAMFGEQAREILLASQRVIPKKLLDHGFNFEHRTIDEALRYTQGSRS